MSVNHLSIAKRIVNMAAEKALRYIPDVEPEHIDVQVFADKMDILLREAYAEKDNLKDKNFINLLRAAKRFIVYVAETDAYYHRWLYTALGVFDDSFTDLDRVFNDAKVTELFNRIQTEKSTRMGP